MLNNLPEVRSAGPRALFLASAVVTALLLVWMRELRQGGDSHGLTSIFFLLFANMDYAGAVCALLVPVGALIASRRLPAGRLLRWLAANPVIVAILCAAVLGAGTLTVYQNHPLAMDEYAAYFQSLVFAAGRLHGTFPPALLDWLIPKGFQDYFLNVSRVTGNVVEAYWPGFSLLLTPFTWARVPWLCNPVISALTVLVVHRIALQLFAEPEAAGMAVLLTIASPVFFADGISYYSMSAHMLANALFALLLSRPKPWRAFLAGVVGSVALVLHNPVPHLLFGAPWIIWIATRPHGFRLLIPLCAGYLPLGAVLGVGWFTFSNQLMSDGVVSTASGVGTDRLEGMMAIFSLPDAPILLARLIGLAKVWIWAVPGMMLLAVVGALRSRHDALCRLLALSAVLTLAGYYLVPVDQGHGWGYRYFHSAWAALPLLATAALYGPSGRSTPAGRSWSLFDHGESRRFMAGCAVLSLIFGVGLRAVQMHTFIADDIKQVPQYFGSERRIVILSSQYAYYGADLVQNDPWLRGNEIRMVSHGRAADARMMARYYPELRQVYEDKYGTVWSPGSKPRAN